MRVRAVLYVSTVQITRYLFQALRILRHRLDINKDLSSWVQADLYVETFQTVHNLLQVSHLLNKRLSINHCLHRHPIGHRYPIGMRTTFLVNVFWNLNNLLRAPYLLCK